MVTRKGILVGMKRIVEYTELSEETVIYLIRDAAFPAKKTKGPSGTWISNSEAIDEWSRAFLRSNLDV